MTGTLGGLHNGTVRISAKADYAIRALLELASRQEAEGPLSTEDIAAAQDMPFRFLQQVLADLRKNGLITGRRGIDGGWRLTRAASAVTLADVIAAVDGPFAPAVSIAGASTDRLDYHGPARPLTQLWTALNRSVRTILETTLADLAAGSPPRASGQQAPFPRPGTPG
jgi:Rrf2 family protein